MKPICPITSCKTRCVHTHYVLIIHADPQEQGAKYNAGLLQDSAEVVSSDSSNFTPDTDTLAVSEESKREKKRKKKEREEKEEVLEDLEMEDELSDDDDSYVDEDEESLDSTSAKKKRKFSLRNLFKRKNKKNKNSKVEDATQGERGPKLYFYRSRVIPWWRKKQCWKIGEKWKKPKDH